MGNGNKLNIQESPGMKPDCFGLKENLQFNKLQFPLILRVFVFKTSKNWQLFLRYLRVFSYRNTFLYNFFANK